MALVPLFLCCAHMTVRHCFRVLRQNGALIRRVVLIGNNAEGRALFEMFEEDPSLGYRVVGLVDDEPDAAMQGMGVVGTIDETFDVVRRARACGVIIAATAIDLAGTNRLVRELTEAGVHVELSSSLRDIASNRLTIRPLGRFPMVYVEPVRRNGWHPVAKRVFDIVLAGMSLVILAPVLLVTAVAIKLDSSGPVIFKQQRVGRDGRLFYVFKFRTMVADAEDRLAGLAHLNEADGPLFKLREDPRITRVGRFLRRRSIDELPQLVNVLRSEMSIVGPRPALPREVEFWDIELRSRLRVSPGITGMWQVHGRSETSFSEYQRLDLFYVDNWSLVTDLMIVLRTVPSVLRGKGAH
jgi:exopolysaccharide biosynthesis polyprenyl glycosylphosphotransferase